MDIPKFAAPEPMAMERHDDYLRRMIAEFENWANRELVPALFGRVTNLERSVDRMGWEAANR